jgi:RecA-family ATPase
MTDINKSYKEVNLQSASTFRIWSIADLEQEPEPEWLIEPFLMVDSQAVLFGAPGDGKSFVALSFALCVASGRKWLGHEVKQGPVLYVAAEGGRGMKKRVRAWLKANGMHDVPEMFFLREAPQLRKPNDLKKLQKTIDQPQKPVLIVLDTVARTMVGADENSAKDVGEWIDAAQKLQQGSGATVTGPPNPLHG